MSNYSIRERLARIRAGLSLIIEEPDDEGETYVDAIEWTIPIRVINSANAREHWSTRAKRVSMERHATLVHAGHAGVTRRMFRAMVPPLLVTFTRIGKRYMDSDGAAIACKGVRDEVAKMLGIDDDPNTDCHWCYRQELSDHYAVSVKIERR